MEIRWSVNGDVQLSRNLRVFMTNLSKMREFYEDAVDIIEKKSDKIFSKAGWNVEKNPKWSPLAASTLKARERRWWYYRKSPSSPNVLRWTWRLQSDRTKVINDKLWSLTFNAPYSIYHQEGSSKLPRRAMIDIDNTNAADIVRALQNKINKDIWISGLQA